MFFLLRIQIYFLGRGGGEAKVSNFFTKSSNRKYFFFFLGCVGVGGLE